MGKINGVIILAGGKSERMNFPKAFLLYRGKTFLKQIVEEYYHAGIKNIYVVLNESFCYGEWEKYLDQVKPKATLIKNSNPELGRFHSLKLGMENMLNSSVQSGTELEFCFIQNIDNPFVNKELIDSLRESRNSLGYTSPIYKGRKGHPILVSKKIIQHFCELPDGNFNLKNLLSSFPKQEVEMKNGDILININTAEDYKKHIGERELSY